MDPSSAITTTIAIRIIGLLLFILSIWQLSGNLLDSIADFNPAYLLFYFKTQLMRPILGIVLAILLMNKRLSHKLGKRLVSDLIE